MTDTECENVGCSNVGACRVVHSKTSMTETKEFLNEQPNLQDSIAELA